MNTNTLSRMALAASLSLVLFGAACGDKDDDTGTGGGDGGADGGTGDGGGDGGGTTGEVECEDGVCIVSGTITEDQVWSADYAWLLRGGVFIGDDENQTVLTIEPGTTVYGESATDGMLVIRRASKLMAEGTAAAPIVFTSSKSPGSRARGDWGGLIINGRAPINACSDPEAEDCEAYGEGGTGWYGGNDPEDSSGILQYVRVEFAGTLISPDNELNGIAFQGVGRGTTIEHIQVHMNSDDGVEFFGGTAQAKYLLTTGIGDDNLDWTDGWQGKVQFVVAQQYDDNGDNGIEADNNGEDNAAEPFSSPTISHITLIGSPDSADSDVGMLLREGTKASISNAIVVGWNDACIDIDNDQTWLNADAGDLALDHSVVSCATNFTADDDPGSVQDWFTGGTGNTAADPKLADPYNQGAPGFVPGSGSPALSGGSAPSDSFFEAATFIGGVDPSDDWTAGWTTSAAN